MVRKSDSVRATRVWLCLFIFAIIIISGTVVLTVRAAAISQRFEAYHYYVLGYQKGRADAASGQAFQAKLGSIQSPAKFSKEYIRGYGDGYQLVNR